MPVPPPDPAELNRVAQRYGLGLSDDDIASFSPMVHGLLASWDAVEELYAASAPAMPERTWTRPDPADNPYNAWYVTCTVTGSLSQFNHARVATGSVRVLRGDFIEQDLHDPFLSQFSKRHASGMHRILLGLRDQPFRK